MKHQLAVFLILFTSNALSGCLTPEGEDKPLGTSYAVDFKNENTLAWHKEFKEKHGVEPDGGAYKNAVCSFIVNLDKQDYPDKIHRKYVWIAAPYGFTESWLAPSYNDEISQSNPK